MLQAYVTPRTNRTVHVHLVCEHLCAYLPDDLIPAHIAATPVLPLTETGKIDREALLRTSLPEPAPTLPRSQMERQMRDIWSDMLKEEHIGISDNFFDLGGNSPLIIDVHSRLRDRSGRTLPVVDRFAFPTIATLANHIRQTNIPSTSQQSDGVPDRRREALRTQ